MVMLQVYIFLMVLKCYVIFQGAVNMQTTGVYEAADCLNEILYKELSSMNLEDIIPLSRAFSHYLNLMGIAETHHRYKMLFFFVLQSLHNLHFLLIKNEENASSWRSF